MNLSTKFAIFLGCGYAVTASASKITTTCLPKTTYDQYQGQGSCVIGDIMFSEFGFSSSVTGSSPSASEVSFQPVSYQGLYSQINLSAVSAPDGSSTFQQVTLSFLESALGGSGIGTLGFDFNGTGTHKGVATVTEDYCIGHPLSGCPSGSGGEELLSSLGPTYSDSVTLPAGVTTLYVAYTAKVVSGIQGSAHIVQFENSNGVPEPNMLPVAAGLVLIALVTARRRGRRSAHDVD